MIAERTAALVGRWVRLYTRGLPAAVAERRIEEVDADLHDHVAHARAGGSSEGRIAVGIASRMLRGLPADAAWRDGVLADHPWAPVEAGRRSRSSYRRALAVAVGGVLVLVWMVGALGIIGDSGDSADLMYAAVLAVGVVGAAIGRFRAAGMRRALVAMAVTQGAIALIAILGGMVPSYNTPLEIVVLNSFFVVLFVGSALLFRRAERQRRHAV